MSEFSRNSRLRDIMLHPLGRDVVDKLVLHTAAPRWLPEALAGMRLGTIDKLSSRVTGGGLMDVLAGMVNRISPETSIEGPDLHPWWRSAVFYQVYPRSFADSDGDGLGDIRGVIAKLDYLAELGVDCVWLSPIFDSPGRDMGYDVRDYRAIMAEMGTLDDVDALIAGCHERGMKIILDLVVNHTSAEHEWFRRAVADPDGEYGDYYFLVDGTPDAPPNNWQSFFSGPAWTWIPEAGKWALHLFDDSQMDLNWRNPRVREEVADIVAWWVDRGIDGFRMDVINYISKTDGLPDGHPFVGELLEFTGIEHYLYGPELDEYLAELRSEGFTRPDGSVAVMIGETPGIGVQAGRLLSGWSRRQLDLIFNFDVLEPPGRTRWHDYAYDPAYLARFWADYNARIGEGDWVSLFVENHDNPRIVSKIAPHAGDDPEVRVAVAKLVATMQLTMRGTPFIYQGQELGAINEPFRSVEDLRDVESVNRYGALRAKGRSDDEAWAEILAGSRDHARTPMRWTEDQDDSGAWLPRLEDTPGFSAEAQMEDPLSVWSWYRELITLRREHSALKTGRLEVLELTKHVFVYIRRDPGSSWLIELNLTGKPRTRPPFSGEATPVFGDRGLTMGPWESSISRVTVEP